MRSYSSIYADDNLALKPMGSTWGVVLFCLIFILQMACRAKGVFHVTVPAPPKVSIFQNVAQSMPVVSVSEDSTEAQSFIILMPPEAFQQKTSQGVVQKNCGEILAVSSSDQTMVLNSTITITDTAGGCQIAFIPNTNASGYFQLIARSVIYPADEFFIPITITAINDPPTISDVSNQTISQDTVLIGVSVSISDPDSTLTCNSITASSSDSTLIPSGNVTISGVVPNCLIRMSPAASQSGEANITVTVSDDLSLAASDSFVLTVNHVNSAPTDLSLSSLSLAENSGSNAVVGNLSATDPDAASTFTYSLVAGTGSTDNASFNILGNQLRQTASADFEIKSSYSILVRATDQGGLFFEKQFAISITNMNEAPTLAAMTDQITLEDTALTVALSPFDADGNLSCTSANFLYSSSNHNVVAASGAVSWSGTWPNCSAVITPVFNNSGSSSLTITVTDGSLTASQIFNLAVTAVNDPPVISDVGNQTTNQDTVLSGVFVSISDPDSTLTCNSMTASSSNTTLIPSGNVTISGVVPNCLVNLSPAASQSGEANITVTVSDDLSLAASDSFVLTVNHVNSAPTDLSLSSLSLAENSGSNAVVGNLSATDPDAASTFTYSLVAGTGSTDNASFNILGNQLRQTASADFEIKSSYSILVRATDQGGLFFEKQFAISITNMNEAPTLAAMTDQITLEDTALTVALSPFDADGNLSCTSANFLYSSSNHNVVAASGAVSWSGTWPNCSAVITPVFNNSGSSSLTITVTDGSLTASQIFNLAVTAVNDPPVISDVGNQTTNQDTVLSGVFVSISDPDSTLTCNSMTASSSNTTLIPSGNVTISGVVPNCLVNLSPAASQSGEANITVTVSDDLSLAASDSFVLTVNHVNSAPTALSLSSLSLAENSGSNAVVGNLSATDPDAASTFTYSLVAGTGSTDNASFNILGNQLRQTASADFEIKSSYSILVRATDQGGLFFEKQFAISITNMNEAPTLAAMTDHITPEDTALTVALSPFDADGNLSCTSANFLYSSSNPNVVAASGAVSWSGAWPNCSAVITPVFNNSGSSSLTITVTDGSLTASQIFNLAVTAVNDTPVISDVGNQTTNQDTVLSGVFVSISDPDSTLTCNSMTASSSNTSLIPSGNVTISGVVPNCLVNLSPAASQSGTSTITLTVSDDLSLAASDSFVLTVNHVNSAPTDLSLSSLTLAENSGANAVVGSLSATDPDTGDTFTYSLVAGTGSTDNASFTVLGNQLRMTASADFEAQSSYEIRLRVTDQSSLFFEKQISITITNINEAPSLSPIADQTTDHNTATSAIAFTITDVDGPAGTCDGTYLNYTSQNPSIIASTGAVSWAGTWPNCTVVITPVSGATGTSLISISVSDGLLTSVPQSFTLQVRGVPNGWYQEAYLKASNGEASDQFGISVAISGTTVVVGANLEDSIQTTITNGTTSSTNNTYDSGASYIYKRTGSTWAQEAYVKASNANGSSSGFGNSVALSRDTVVVGAPEEASNQSTITNGTTSSANYTSSAAGASYIYKRTVSTWAQEAYLKASNSNMSDFFGSSVALSGDTVVVGAPAEASNQTTITAGTTSSTDNSAFYAGASYIYKRTGSTWAQEAYVKASNANAEDNFGHSNAMSGDTVVVGAYFEASNQTTITNGSTSSSDNTAGNAGASYIYKRTGSTWVQEAYLKASNTNGSDQFGSSVAVSGDTVVVGAEGEDSNQTTITNGSTSSAEYAAPESGASYIYKRTGSSWAQEAYLKASNSNASDYFGYSVALSGDTVVVGAIGEDSSQTTITNGTTSSTDISAASAGASYIYKRTGSTWAQEAYLKASNSNANAYFGSAVAISGDTVVVGAFHEDSSQTTITNGTTSSTDNTAPGAGAVYVYRNLSRPFEAHELLSSATSSSFALSWNGSNLGSGNGIFKVVYSTSAPGVNCSSGTVAYTGTATSVTVSSGLTPGQNYIVRICTFDGASYSEGITTEVKIKGEEIGPTVLNITRGATPNPVSMGTPLIDYIVTFDEPVIGVNSGNFSFTEVVTTSGASGQVSSISCSGSVCTVLVAHGNSGQLRLDLTNPSGISDVWGNPLASGKTGDETFTLRGWHQEAYLKASNANAHDWFGYSLAISGDTAVVGALGEDSNQTTITNGATSSADNTASNAGASYIYKRTGTTWAQEAYLKASNANASDYFGTSVAISGDTAVIGAYGEASNQTTITNGSTSSPDNMFSISGASYIYKRTGSAWAQEAYLKASNTNGSNLFGSSVDISGDSAVIGSHYEDSNQTTITNGTTSSTDISAASAGASYIYKRTGSTWAQEAYLKASNSNANAYFGSAVAISGDTVVVGAFHEDSNQTTITNGTTSSADNTAVGAGASYIYKRTGSTWFQEAYLKASNANSADVYGTSVDLSGDSAVFGAHGEDSNQTMITNGSTSSADNTVLESGASYIYKRTGTTWAQEAYIKASNANASDNFGTSVAISGDTVVVGAFHEDSNQTTITNGTTSSADNTVLESGASYIYKKTGSTWAQEAYLKASNAKVSDYFGYLVAISGDTAVVRASVEDSNQTTITNGATSSANNTATNSGAVYVYRNPSRLFDPDLFVSAKTATSVTLSWGSNLGSTTQVKIAPVSLGTNHPLPCTDSTAIALGTGVTSYVYSGLTPATSYGFRVCGFDGTNVGEGSVIWQDTD